MKIHHLTTIFLAVTQVSAAGINPNVRDIVNDRRDPNCRLRDRGQHTSSTPCTTPKKTTTTCKTTTRKTTAKTTPKTTSKVTTTKIKTTKTTKSACGTESAQCDPTGTALPPCCTGQCLQGFNFFYCRSNCIPDGAPCSLDDPGACCGQVCLVDGSCLTIG